MQLSTRFILLAIKQITFKIYRVVVLFGTGVRSDEILSATLIDMPDLCIHFHRTIMSYHHAPPSPSYGNRHIVTILLCIAKRISFHVESTNQQIVGTDTWRWSLLLNWNSFAHLFLYMHNLFVIIPSVASPSYYNLLPPLCGRDLLFKWIWNISSSAAATALSVNNEWLLCVPRIIIT